MSTSDGPAEVAPPPIPPSPWPVTDPTSAACPPQVGAGRRPAAAGPPSSTARSTSTGGGRRRCPRRTRCGPPLEVPLDELADRPVDVVPEAIRSYFRDELDHAIRVRTQVASLDELLTSILQASLARTTLADNEDMRKISAWAGIIAVPTAIAGIAGIHGIAGIYGINVENMPELPWRWGCSLVLLVIVASCALLHRGPTRNGWL